MNFQNLSKVEKAQWYIDLALRNAKSAGDQLKGESKKTPNTIKNAEIVKIAKIRRVLTRQFNLILMSFPTVDKLPIFYLELIKTTLDYGLLKQSLGSIRWSKQKIEQFSDIYAKKIRKCPDFQRMLTYSREYYGRICSIVKNISKQLEYLELCRRTMKAYPAVKSNMFTVAIAGFPNVGKTTLLSKLTGSTPEIANYAFTTKTLNMGYSAVNGFKIQFIDTPGTLNRFEKMNQIEQQAYLAIKFCADAVIFVFDPSDQSWDVIKQKKLLESVHKFNKEFFIYVSKTDIVEKQDLDTFLKQILKEQKYTKKLYNDSETLKENLYKYMLSKQVV